MKYQSAPFSHSQFAIVIIHFKTIIFISSFLREFANCNVCPDSRN